jgi:ribosome-associated protein|tara:strand:- start:442 stop:861 length:420 start_codon:yes stop_codon:yes gene_type:complete
MIHITDSITIFENQIDFKAIRSSGPGGQHVNKVSTAISLKYDVLTQNYPSWFLTQLKLNAGSQFSKNGIIILKAQSYRSQVRNKDDALTRLIHLFKQSAIRPRKRMKTIPPKSVNQNRLTLKKLQSKKKILRKPPKLDE